MLEYIKCGIILNGSGHTTNSQILITGIAFLTMGTLALLIIIKSPFEGAFKVDNYTSRALGIFGIIIGIYYIIKYIILLF
jgi:hypothetical protein